MKGAVFLPHNHTTWLRIATFLLGTLLFLLWPRPIPTLAQDQSSPCTGIDIVFVIDQSGSMEFNDRNQIRSNAVRTALDILGDNALYFCAGIQHRVAVLGFGDQTVSYVSPTILSPSLATIQDWNAQKQQLKQAIPPADNQGNTNHELALRSAAQILRDWHSQSLGGAPRKRAVILVTDGDPCIPGEGCILGSDTFDRKAYMQRLEDGLANPQGPDLPWRGADHPDSVSLWMIGLRDQSSPNAENLAQTEEAWRRIMQSHGGDLFLLQTAEQGIMNADMTSKVADILDTLLRYPQPTVPCSSTSGDQSQLGKTFWVDPYVSSVLIVHIFRRGAQPGVAIENVAVRIKATYDNQPIATFSRGTVEEGQGRIDDYTLDSLNERYVFYSPPPGKYEIEVDPQQADLCRHLDVRVGQSSVKGEVLAPGHMATFTEVDQVPYYDQQAPVPFRIQLSQQGAQNTTVPLQEVPGFPLDVRVTLRSGAGVAVPEEEQFSLVRVDDAQAIYESKGHYISMRYPGEYTWELVATTRNPQVPDGANQVGTPIVVLQEQGAFTVKPLQREFDFNLTHPPITSDDIGIIDGAPVQPVQIEVQVVGTNGAPLGRDISSGSSTASPLIAKLVTEQGQLLATQPLRLEGVDRYVADIMGGQAPPQRYELGCYLVHVELVEGYQSEVFIPRKKSTDSARFCLRQVERFSWQITEPVTGTHRIHPAWRWFPPPEPLPIVVRFQRPDGGPLDPGEVVKAPGTLPIAGSLRGPNGEVVLLAFRPSGRAGELIADWPSAEVATGQYRFEVSLAKETLSPFWMPVSEQGLTRDVERKDGIFECPWTPPISVGVVVLVVFFLAWLSCRRRRPQGLVSFYNDNDSQPAHEEKLGQLKRASGKTYISKDPRLQDAGLVKMCVSKTEVEGDGNTRAISLQLYDHTKEDEKDVAILVFDGTVQSGNTEYYFDGNGRPHRVYYQ